MSELLPVPRAGLYQKFTVNRTDGSSRKDGKHCECDYFVLDWIHDEFAIPAALAYAEACRLKYPELARDLKQRAAQALAARHPTEPTR